MSAVTLKSLHAYLLLLENSSELKRRLPNAFNPRTLKEGLDEMSALIGVDAAVFKDPQTLAAMIGAPRFVIIWGEPSVTDHVARVFDGSRLLLTGFVSAAIFDKVAGGQPGASPQRGGAPGAAAAGSAQPNRESSADLAHAEAEREVALEDLKPLLSGNLTLTCRLFRGLFEHMLGFMSPSVALQGNASLVAELTGGRDQSRSFLSTALFILGAELDPDHLMAFMMQQGLVGLPIFEHMLQNRDYCGAFYTFRRLERAFTGPPAAEEAQLRGRFDQFNAQLGGKPCLARIFEANEPDKLQMDAHLAATDLLEAMALTPWWISLKEAVSIDSSYSIRSAVTIARHFERFARGQAPKDQVNQEIADHLLAFARQFSPDTQPAEPRQR